MEAAARGTFEINNNVQVVDAGESVFLYDERPLADQEPWKNDPHYFHTVKISAVALIKMYEIMGVMYGKVRDGAFWITDAAALPVQGTETRVNAGNEAMEYMVQFQQANERAGKMELLRGWYHSHPGYGCWLSGIDVDTQLHHQKFFDPYLAVVIDPNRTVATGKVEIGAFRTFPEGYTPASAKPSEYQSIPIDKIEDFGVHAEAYYPLKVEIFKTKADEKLLDLLWNKYWVATLSQSPSLTNRAYRTSQLKDLKAKLGWAAGRLPEKAAELQRRPAPPTAEKAPAEGDKKQADQLEFSGVEPVPTALSGPTKDSASQQIAHEALNGMVVQAVKHQLFNQALAEQPISAATAAAATRGAWA